MGILQELDRGERKLLMMAVKELGNPLGHIAMDVFDGQIPEDFKYVELLVARGFLKMTNQTNCRDPNDRTTGTRSFYRLTDDGVKVATELQTHLSKGAPDTLEGYKLWANKLFTRLLENAPAGVDMRPHLNAAKDQLNLLATRFEIISKEDEENETWEWDVIQRVTTRN